MDLQGLFNRVFDETAGALRVLGDLLVAADPSEVDLDTVGDTTTLTLTDAIARLAFPYETGLYYFTTPPAASTVQAHATGTLLFSPVILRAGTIDRLAINVTTANATAVSRVGIYADNGGRPGNLVAEGTDAGGGAGYPLNCASTGIKEAAMAASITKNGLYWAAFVNQTAAISTEGGNNSVGYSWTVLPQGTAATTNANYRPVLTQASVTGALPASATASNSPSGTRIQMQFRYSA